MEKVRLKKRQRGEMGDEQEVVKNCTTPLAEHSELGMNDTKKRRKDEIQKQEGMSLGAEEQKSERNCMVRNRRQFGKVRSASVIGQLIIVFVFRSFENVLLDTLGTHFI